MIPPSNTDKSKGRSPESGASHSRRKSWFSGGQGGSQSKSLPPPGSGGRRGSFFGRKRHESPPTNSDGGDPPSPPSAKPPATPPRTPELSPSTGDGWLSTVPEVSLRPDTPPAEMDVSEDVSTTDTRSLYVDSLLVPTHPPPRHRGPRHHCRPPPRHLATPLARHHSIAALPPPPLLPHHRYHDELTAFYERFAPEKLEKIEEILDHWNGHYPQMMDQLSAKYVEARPAPSIANQHPADEAPSSSHHRFNPSPPYPIPGTKILRPW